YAILSHHQYIKGGEVTAAIIWFFFTPNICIPIPIFSIFFTTFHFSSFLEKRLMYKTQIRIREQNIILFPIDVLKEENFDQSHGKDDGDCVQNVQFYFFPITLSPVLD
ncbi:hypothetical protein ACJX0J_028442, partial [Zea mays]